MMTDHGGRKKTIVPMGQDVPDLSRIYRVYQYPIGQGFIARKMCKRIDTDL